MLGTAKWGIGASILVVMGLALPAAGQGQVSEPPNDLVVLRSVMPALAEQVAEILPASTQGRRWFVNPTAVRHNSRKGDKHEPLSLGEGGPAALPLGARLLASDCGNAESLFDCGLDVGDAIVYIGPGAETEQEWVVFVSAYGPLNARGDKGGATFRATLRSGPDGWELKELVDVAIP